MKEPLLLASGAEPPQPTYPQTSVSINASGMRLTVVLAAGVEFSTTLNEETMNQITKMWLQTRRNIQDQLRVIQKVQESKLN